MNKRQIAKQKVIRAALATLLEKKALWETLPGMVKDVDALAAVKTALEAGAESQAVTSRGATDTQEASRKTLRRLTRIAGRLLADYAGQSGAVELAGNARVNSRVLRQGSLAEALAEVRRIETLATAHPEAFVDSFKDPEFLKNLGDAIAAFESVMGKPRIVIVTRAVATAQVEKSIHEGRRLLLKLDALVSQFEDEDPAFVTTWKHALKGRAPQPQMEAVSTIVSTPTPAPEAKAA